MKNSLSAGEGNMSSVQPQGMFVRSPNYAAELFCFYSVCALLFGVKNTNAMCFKANFSVIYIVQLGLGLY